MSCSSTVCVKRDEHGIAISMVSAPWIQAMMLEQAGLRPGLRVLEIGSGGYNAALLADDEGGVPDHAPYDRIIVTVGAWDIPRRGPSSSPRADGSSSPSACAD